MMISIIDIINLMNYFEKFLLPCSGCGIKPRFFYMDTCTTESIIRIDHNCTTQKCTKTESKINLLTLSQMRDPKQYIGLLLAKMQEDWNELQRPRVYIEERDDISMNETNKIEYISKEALKRDLIDNRSFYPSIVKAAIESAPAANVIEVDKFASKIAGHSYYHGDKILTRLYCLKEGQEIEESIEPADAVEVVRCKYCEHYEPYCKPVEDFDGRCRIKGHETDETEFCSYGIEKEDAKSENNG